MLGFTQRDDWAQGVCVCVCVDLCWVLYSIEGVGVFQKFKRVKGSSVVAVATVVLGSLFATIPGTQTAGAVAPVGACVSGDAGGVTIFGNTHAPGWIDYSWAQPAVATAGVGVGGSAGLKTSQALAQWGAVALRSTAGNTGADVVSFTVKGSGSWRVEGVENGVEKGQAPFTATSSWQTFTCRFPGWLTAGPVDVVFKNVGGNGQEIVLDDIRLSNSSAPSTTTSASTSTTSPPVTSAGVVAAVGSCAAGDMGGDTVFGDSLASGWADISWPAAASPVTGVSGTGLQGTKNRYEALAFRKAAGNTGADVVSFAVTGAGSWRVEGIENGTVKGTAPFTATSSWQTMNCRFPGWLTAGPVDLVLKSLDQGAHTITLDNIKLINSGSISTTAPPATTVAPNTPTTTATSPSSTVPPVSLPASSATPGTCAVGDLGGVTVFADSFASGWSDLSWPSTANLGTSGVGGSNGLSVQSRTQWGAITVSGNLPGGANVVSSAVKGKGNWRASGLEQNGAVSRGYGSFTATDQWQTLNCRFDAPIITGPIWVAFQNTDGFGNDLTVDNIKLSTAATSATLGKIVTSNVTVAGNTATPATSNGTISTQTIFTGPGMNGAEALRLDVNTAVGFAVTVSNETGTTTYAEMSFAAGNTVHRIALATALSAERVKITITPTAGSVTLKNLEFKNNPFVPVTVTATTSSSVTASIGALPEPGVPTFLRAIPATEPNNCNNCGGAVQVTAAGSYTLGGLTSGPWRLVMYTNTAQETVGTSNDFNITGTVTPPTVPPTTNPPTTTPPTTAAPTTVVATTSTTTSTTTPPNPNYPGKLSQVGNWGSAPGALADCYPLGTRFGDSGLDVPAAAWNSARFSITVGQPNAGSENGWYWSYAVYQTAEGSTESVSRFGGFHLGNTDYEPGGSNDRLIKIPAGSRLRGWSVDSMAICARPINGGTGVTPKADLWVSIPAWPSGIHLPNPGSTSPYINPPTGPAPVDPTPQPFQTTSNHLRSRFTDTTFGDICLQPSSGNVQVGACATGTTPIFNLSFNQYNQNQFRINPLGDRSTCLQISDRDHPVYDGAAQRFALIAQWGPCDNPFTTRPGHNGFMDELFTFAHTGNGYYNIKPAQNYPNWPDPCLSIFAAPGNNGITGNVLGSNAPPVIQYNCSGNPAWQQWAPAETNGYTVPTSCTNNCPPPPTGAHTLQHEVVTPLERKTDLACIRLQGDLATPATPEECRYFNPELVANGWLLHDENNFNQCLGRLPGGLDVGLTDCTTTSIWDDRPIQTDGLTFPLVNTSSGLCLGGTTSPRLEYCTNPVNSNQLWYDATGVTLKQLINMVGDSEPKLTTDEEKADYAEVKAQFSSFGTLQSQLARGTIAALPPLSPMQQVIKSIWGICKPGAVTHKGCFVYVWGFFSYLHNLVQKDIASRVGTGKSIECTLGQLSGGAPAGSTPAERKLRIDNASPSCASPNIVAEVKSYWPTTIALGKIPITAYKKAWTDNGVPVRFPNGADTATGWPSNLSVQSLLIPGLSPNIGQLYYQYQGSGVFAYWVNDWKVVAAVLMTLAVKYGVTTLVGMSPTTAIGSALLGALVGKTPEQQIDILLEANWDVLYAAGYLAQQFGDALAQRPPRANYYPVPIPPFSPFHFLFY
jgi:hypothetical protein